MKVYQYNKRRENALPLAAQYEGIKRFWGNNLLSIGLNKDDKNYITFTIKR